MMTPSDPSHVNVVLDLPKQLADDVEHMRRRDPEFMERALRYALVRQVFFEEMRLPEVTGR